MYHNNSLSLIIELFLNVDSKKYIAYYVKNL